MNYEQLLSPQGFSLTEYSLQEENSVLAVLRKSRAYTISFFPGDESKKDVQMQVWQLPVANWKLKCTAASGKDINTAIDSFQSTEPWQKYAKDVMGHKSLYLAMLVISFPLFMLTPIFVPMMFYFYADLLKYSGETASMLSSGQLGGTVPAWVNGCLDASSQITPPSEMDFDLSKMLMQVRIIHSLALVYYIAGSILLAIIILVVILYFCFPDYLADPQNSEGDVDKELEELDSF